ncbi:MAG TPA: glycosyltransferase family 2 protein [Pseudogracilibacillus sp.]|nr:glycosyltransferase family 2 protein [Pseudogracilibacillus sp.]
MKELSIIIPHFNSVKLLKKLISSIPINDNIEVIVIDDKSTEGLEELELLKVSPNFNHVIYLTNKTPIQSAGKCRNLGLEIASGKWVLFADADDFFLKNFYETVQKYFESNYDVVLFSPTSIYIDTNKIADRHEKFDTLINNYIDKKSLKNEVKLRYEYVVPWSKLIKRSFIKKHDINFDEVIAMNDIMFSTKVGYYMKSYLATPETIYCVTRNKGSLTMLMTKEVHDSRTNALLRYYGFIKDNVPKKQRKYLNLSSISALVRTYKSGLGYSEVISTYKTFKNNNIKTFDRRFLNPVLILKKFMTGILFNKKEERFYEN